MAEIDTGFGSTVSIERGALIVAITSAALLLVLFVTLGQDPWMSLFEVALGGIVMGTAYYLGLRARS